MQRLCSSQIRCSKRKCGAPTRTSLRCPRPCRKQFSAIKCMTYFRRLPRRMPRHLPVRLRARFPPRLIYQSFPLQLAHQPLRVHQRARILLVRRTPFPPFVPRTDLHHCLQALTRTARQHCRNRRHNIPIQSSRLEGAAEVSLQVVLVFAHRAFCHE
jgi:hypothetical protein